ncbi:hypothetical protein QL285_029198 [Trifolium repens]|nr:hypothetical protein QL285_029198 [Trifolium repens]
MLMESAIRCDRVTPLKRDRYLEPELEPEPEQKRLKSEQEPKLTSDSNESDSDESDSDESDSDSLEKQVKSEQESKLTSDSDESDDDSLEKRVKLEQEKAREEADKVYREKCRGLSPYDAIPRPQKSQLCSTSYNRLLVITEDYLHVLQRLSKLALDYYKKVSGASFEFHGIVKCNYNFDSRPFYRKINLIKIKSLLLKSVISTMHDNHGHYMNLHMLWIWFCCVRKKKWGESKAWRDFWA